MTWKVVCKLSELVDGELCETNVVGIKILLVRVNQSIFAYPPFCPHMEEPLVNGFCDGETLTCAKHLWQWNISTGAAEGAAEKPLLMYETKIEEENVYIRTDAELQYEYD